ncbi:MAG TPA: hypothetical protein VMU17_05135 [Elusimicrobiota bacterium]|nr:hypothetical protein [Elusimicrobiota bacterium]
MKRTRARLAEQRERQHQQWEAKPAAFRRSMIRWMLRIVAITLILVLALYRFGGGRIF